MGNIFNNTSNLQALLNIANNLPEANNGVELPTLINEGSASDLLMDKEFIDSEGKIVIGTMPSTAQATPSISIDSNGLITATATQNAGYVNGGTKSATKQLAFQSAKTITPTTIDQIIEAGTYCAGAQTIKGDTNLQRKNIKTGVTLFGIKGTCGQDEDKLISGEFEGYYINHGATAIKTTLFSKQANLYGVEFTACSIIGQDSFKNCPELQYASFPMCKTILSNAFEGCPNLNDIYFPACETIENHAFYNCDWLTTISFPACQLVTESAFKECNSLYKAYFPACKSFYSDVFYGCSKLTLISAPLSILGAYAFYSCYRLSTVVLGGSTVCGVGSLSGVFYSTPYTKYSAYFSGTPYIYVPASLVSAYQSATNWSYFSSYFRAIEDMPQS